MLRVTCDVHTHTLYSRHAYSTIEECVRAASSAGIELLGSADHFGNMLHDNPGYLDFQYFINRNVWPRRWMGVIVLRSAEADICDLHGHLYGWDMRRGTNLVGDPCPEFTALEHVARGSDYLVASVHGKRWAEGASRAQLTQTYVNALAHEKVLILGHIGRSGLDFEIDPVVEAARDQHKLIEINEHSFHYEGAVARCRAIAERCAELGCRVSLATDAHISCDVGRLHRCVAMLDEIHFPEGLVASRDPRAFLEAMRDVGLEDLTELANESLPDGASGA